MSNNKNNENNFSTAVETIKLLGEHVLELRDVIDKQREEIKTLKAECAKMFDTCKELTDDFKLVQIDQKDLSKQIKQIKQTATVMQRPEPVAEVPSYDEIVKRYYPSYAQNPEFEPRSKAIKNPKAMPAMPAKPTEPSFNFARLPRFLNLD